MNVPTDAEIKSALDSEKTLSGVKERSASSGTEKPAIGEAQCTSKNTCGRHVSKEEIFNQNMNYTQLIENASSDSKRRLCVSVGRDITKLLESYDQNMASGLGAVIDFLQKDVIIQPEQLQILQRKLQSMTQLYNSCAHNLKQKDTEKEQLLEKLKHTNHTVTLLQESLERKRSQERIY